MPAFWGGAVFPAHTHIASSSSNYIAEFKTGFIVGVAVGASLTESLRGEVELSYLSSDVKQVTEGDSEADDTGNSLAGTFLLANLWYDMSWAGFTPYLGGGIGMALMDVDIILDDAGDEHIDDQSLALAAQIGAGVRFAVTDTLTIDAGYRFKSALGVATDGAEDGSDAGYASYYANVGQVGVSWTF